MIHRPGLGEFPPGAQMPMRILDDCELVWILQGTAQLTGSKELALLPGDLIFIPPATRHGILWDARRLTRHGYVHFDASELSVSVPEGPERVRMTADDPLAGLCAYLLWLGAGDLDDWVGHARRALDYLLGLMVELPLPSESSALPMSRPLRAAVEHLKRRWADTPLERVGVTELAGAAAVSRGHLTRVFHHELGVSPARAMERLRCARAEILLSRTDLTLAVIAI